MSKPATMAVSDIPNVGDLLTSDQLFALEMQTKTAAYYLDVGFAALDELLDEKHDFYPAGMQLLGSGLEHLLKTALALATIQVEGRPPTIGRMKKVVGHDLLGLRNLVAMMTFVDPLGSCEVAEGLKLGSRALLASPLVDSLLGILGGYGTRDRYYYLDNLLQPDPDRPDPFRAFRDWMTEDTSEASWDLYEDDHDAEFSPLMAHILADRPGSYRKERKEVVYLNLVGFVAVLSIFCVWFRADGEQGALKRYVRARTLLRPPPPWYGRPRIQRKRSPRKQTLP